jgi:hypothetical protein
MLTQLVTLIIIHIQEGVTGKNEYIVKETVGESFTLRKEIHFPSCTLLFSEEI